MVLMVLWFLVGIQAMGTFIFIIIFIDYFIIISYPQKKKYLEGNLYFFVLTLPDVNLT